MNKCCVVISAAVQVHPLNFVVHVHLLTSAVQVHLMHFAVAEPTEEVVQLALVGARAHSKDALHVGQAS